MNKALAAMRHRWFAFAGLVVATAASALFFLGGLYATQDQGLPIAIERYSSERLADGVLAFASTPVELLPLPSDASTSAPLDPLATTRLIDAGPAFLDHLADPGNAGRANAHEGFTSDGFSAGSSPLTGEKAEKSAPQFPTGEPADSTASSRTSPAYESVTSSLLSGQAPDIIDTDTALLPGRAPDIIDTGAALASESRVPSGAGSEEPEQRTTDATKEHIVVAEVTSSPVVLDAPTTAVSIAPSQAEDLDQIFEHGTLVLLGLLGLAGLGFALTAKFHRWFALAGLVVTTQATAPIFLGGLYATQDQGLPITVEGYSSGLADELLAIASTPAELPSLLADASTLAPFDLDYLADRSADPGIAGGANAYEDFANGGFSAGGNAALATISDGAMPTIGGHAGAIPPMAAWFGGGRVATATAPRSSTEHSTGSDLTITKSPGTETPTAGVPTDESADSIASSRTLIAYESVISSLLWRQTPDIIDTDTASPPGQAPDIIDTGTALASESRAPSGAGSEETEQRTTDATKEHIIVAEVTSSPVVLDAPTTEVSIAPSQTEGPNQVSEPGTLALIGLGLLGLAGLSFWRRTQ